MWYKNKCYIKAREQFISGLHPSSLSYLHSNLPKMLFICGGDEKAFKNRSVLESYINRHHSLFLTFRAEYAWDVISKDKESSTVNALALEEWLADFSDIVIILVESFGTVAELGAFSLSHPLRKKLLPILDKKFEKEESFINTGPVRWVNADSKFGPSIYTNFDTILTCMPEIEERLSRRTYSIGSFDSSLGKYRFTRKVLLFFMLHIVAALGPVSIREITSISSELIEVRDKSLLSFVISLGCALDIFDKIKIDEEDYFFCHDFDKFFRHHSTKALLHEIQRNRARSLALLLKINEYQKALREAARHAT